MILLVLERPLKSFAFSLNALDRHLQNIERHGYLMGAIRCSCKESSLGKEMRLWELAQLAGMSPHYFCELFKKSTGVSPHQYVMRCRINRAKILLRSPELTVNRVANAIGFVDQGHFAKSFRRIVGVTPTQFRRMS